MLNVFRNLLRAESLHLSASIGSGGCGGGSGQSGGSSGEQERTTFKTLKRRLLIHVVSIHVARLYCRQSRTCVVYNFHKTL